MKLLTKAEAQSKLDSQKAERLSELNKVQQQISSVAVDKQNFLQEMDALREDVTKRLQEYIEECNTQRRTIHNELVALQEELDRKKREIAPTMQDAERYLDVAQKTLSDVTVREGALAVSLQKLAADTDNVLTREVKLQENQDRLEHDKKLFTSEFDAYVIAKNSFQEQAKQTETYFAKRSEVLDKKDSLFIEREVYITQKMAELDKKEKELGLEARRNQAQRELLTAQAKKYKK